MSEDDTPKVEVLRCEACGALDAGPRDLCPHCLRRPMVPVDVPGTGRLVSWTMVRRAPTRFRGEAPYAVAAVELDAGIRVTGRLENASDEIAPGTRVVASGAGSGYAIFRSAG
jgi:uncharacterized OB-fold protein